MLLPLNLRTYKTAVFDHLAEMISELELLPGQRLIEADLAEAFGVSKTPIREALILLQAEGLISVTPYLGAQVTWLSIEEFEELTFLLDALEKPALPIIIGRLAADDISAGAQLVERLVRARQARDSRVFGELNARLHERLFQISSSGRLTRIVAGLVGRPGRRYAKVFEHQFDDAWDIELEVIVGRFEGIRSGNAGAAADAIETGHAKLIELAKTRVDHPDVRRYLAPDADPRTGTSRVARRSRPAAAEKV
jgi:DNA-binding GntR family transcriptional regulator